MIDRTKYKTTGEYLKAKYGEDYYRELGRRGGKAKVPKGFSKNRKLASKAGRVGGKCGRPYSKNPRPETEKGE